MKKYLIIALLAIVSCFTFAYGCKKSTENDFIFNEYNTVLQVGDTKQLTADGKDLQWSTSDDTVVSVDQSGLITAVKVGNADITVTNGKVSKSITVYVLDAGIPKLIIDDSDKYVKVGGSYKIEYSFTLNGEPYAQTATFESLDNAVATVSDQGVITGVASGKTAVKLIYTVSIKGVPYEFSKTINVTVASAGVFTLDQTEVTLVVKTLSGKNDVEKKVSVSQKIFDGADTAEIEWTSLNPDVATVDNDGLISAVSAGETSVIASVKGNAEYSASVSVYVDKENVYLNDNCFADANESLSTEIAEWASLNIYDGNFYGEIQRVTKTTGVEVAFENGKLLTQPLNVGNNDLIIETADFNYYATVKLGRSYYEFENYDLTVWEGSRGDYEVLDEFENKTNVLKTLSTKPLDGEILEEEPAEIKYHDVANNNVGLWNLTASNLYGKGGYLTFNVFVEAGSITDVGYYLILEKQGSTDDHIIRFNTERNEFSFSYGGKGRGEFGTGIATVVDDDYNQTEFKRGEWNKVLINMGMLDASDVVAVKFVISFVNNTYKDGQQTAYYSDFAFISDKQFYDLTGGTKTVCQIDKRLTLEYTGVKGEYYLQLTDTEINVNGISQIKYQDVKVNEQNTTVCVIADAQKGQILELTVETEYKTYVIEAVVTIPVSNENDKLIFDTEWQKNGGD